MTDRRPALAELPLGAVRPLGWLLSQLRLQAEGITGRLDEVWQDVGPNNAWLGGTGDDWERGPYYLDGLLPLAHVLDDGALKAKADKWIESILGSQREDGQFGPSTNDDWWPRMVALKALTQHADATGDSRVVDFLRRYFRYQLSELPVRPLRSWGRARGADNVLSVLWLYQRTGDAWLLDLGRILLAQTAEWATFVLTQLKGGTSPDFKLFTHGPNVAMGLKTPAVDYLVNGDRDQLGTTLAMFDALDRLHGLVHGVFSGDEWLAGRDPVQGVETCQVVELLFTLEQAVRVFGSARFGDHIEQVAFNLLPASSDARMLAHQYHQQANQVLVSVAERPWSYSGDDANIFGLEPHYGCCTANLHQGWPKLVRSLWMAGPGANELTVIAYAPCSVDAVVGEVPVHLRVDTEYPFEEHVRITIEAESAVTFGLRLRLPSWCTAPTILVAGQSIPAEPDENGYVAVERTWTSGEVVVLRLPMVVRLVPRDRGAVGVRLGPLVLVHAIGENWWPVPDAPGLGEWHITPRASWNIGLCVEPPESVDSWPITRRPVSEAPFGADAAVEVRAPGGLVHDWTLQMNCAGTLPQSPVAVTRPIESRRLVPYGCARIRIAEFPTVVPAAHATEEEWVNDGEWTVAPPEG